MWDIHKERSLLAHRYQVNKSKILPVDRSFKYLHCKKTLFQKMAEISWDENYNFRFFHLEYWIPTNTKILYEHNFTFLSYLLCTHPKPGNRISHCQFLLLCFFEISNSFYSQEEFIHGTLLSVWLFIRAFIPSSPSQGVIG